MLRYKERAIQTESDQAYMMQRNSNLSQSICKQLASADKGKDTRRLAILVEKHLLSGEDSELLKENGLTILDCITGSLDQAGIALAESIVEGWNRYLGVTLFNVPPEG